MLDLTVASSSPGQIELGLLTPTGVTLVTSGRQLTTSRLAVDGGLWVRLTGSTRSDLTLTVVSEGRTLRSVLDVKGALTAPVETSWPPFRPLGLSFDAEPRGPVPTDRLIAWSESAVATVRFPGDRAQLLPAPPGVIQRVEGHPGWRSSLFAATAMGLFISREDGGWRQVDLGLKVDCGAGVADLRVLGTPGTPVELAVVTSGGAATCMALLGAVDGGSLQRLADDSVCAPTFRVRGLRPAPGGVGATIDCELDGGTERSVSVCLDGATCPGSRGVEPGGPAPLLRARADWPDLHLDALIDWRGFPAIDVADGLDESRTRPLFGSLQVATTRTFDLVTSTTLAPDASVVLIGRRGPDAGLERFAEVAGAGLGLDALTTDLHPLTTIPLSTWWLGNDGTVRAVLPQQDDGGPGPLAWFSPVRPLTAPPPVAARWRSDGGALIVLANEDALLAGEAGAGGQLDLRLVPASRSAISSVSIAPAPLALLDGGTVEVTGHTIALGRLYRYEARNRVWRSEEIGLNELAIATWYDGTRARVGVDTGEILGLPSRVPISQKVPWPPATQFVSACRQTWAVTAGGVHRLVPADGGLASWVRDGALHDALGPHTNEAAVTLTSSGEELIAMTPEGVVARRRLEGCPPR
ncbi:MAG: hypothetical protein SFW67_32565 [Myxococcaceae bacterium]|nr:hypothetical protein [Myxococcaceae bacterium]